MARFRNALPLVTMLALVPASTQAQPQVGPSAPLPGDRAVAPAVERQTQASIAASDFGFLAVWTERRVSSSTSFNGTDVYGARLDADGNVLDEEPLLISTLEHQQTGARVAWGGDAWLVTFRSQRTTDFFLEEDLVGVRIAPDGGHMDPDPIVLTANVRDEIGDAEVAGNGAGWVVVWPQFGHSGVRGVRGARVGSDGTVLDPGGIDLWFDPTNTYANDPQVIWGGDRWLVTWNRNGTNLVGMRFDDQLAAIDAQPFAIASGIDADLAFGGGTFYAVFSQDINTNEDQVKGARVPLSGPTMDPGGVALGETLFVVSDFAPSAVWNGGSWTVVYAGDGSGGATFDFDLKMRRVGADGQPIGAGPIVIDAGEDNVGAPTIDTGTAGPVVVWQRRGAGGIAEDLVAALVGDDGLGRAAVALSVGRPRQLDLEVTVPGPTGQRLALFRSQTSGASRLLALRLSEDGVPIDLEPTEVAAGPEVGLHSPRAAWNGVAWLVVWQDDSTAMDGIVGRRFDADLMPLGAAVTYLPNHEDPAVAALGATFLVAGAEIQAFHEPQRWLRFTRIDSDGVPLDAEPTLLAAGFERAPRAIGFGGRWLLVWESQTSHDNLSSSIDVAWIGPDGLVDSIRTGVDGPGNGDAPDVAIDGGRGYLVWHDNGVFIDADIEGRSIEPNGALGPISTISSARWHQTVPRVDALADGWLVAWHDLRHLPELAERRPDPWAARIGADGSVLDPDGFPVVVSLGAELAIDVVASGAGAQVFYAGLEPPFPGGYRLMRRGVGPAKTLLFTDGFESGDATAWAAAVGVMP